MGLGIQGAFGAMGAQQTLQQILASRRAEQMMAEHQRQQDIQNSQRDRQLSIQETAAQPKPAPPERPMSMNPGSSLVDPSTGRIITSIPAAEKPAAPQRPISLAPGGSLVDPSTGRIITQIPDRPKDKPERAPHRVVQQGIDAQGNPIMLTVDLETGAATPVQMPDGVHPNRPAKPVTGAERQTLAFYNRMKDAVDTLTTAWADKSPSLEDQVAAQSVGSQLQGAYAPNMLQSELQQRYRQAQRSYTEARLRKESGAAIPESEFQNDARTYFAQPGDTPAVKKQKAAARQKVLEGLKFSSGRAYDEFYGPQAGEQGGAQGNDPLGIR